MRPDERKLIAEIRRECDQRHFASAHMLCERLLAKSKRNVEGLFLMGSILHAGHRTDEALKYLERAADLEPGNLEILLALARVQTVLPGRIKAALRCADAALRIEPGLPAAIRIKAQLLDMRGDREELRALLEPAAREHPDDPDIGYHLARAMHGLGDQDAAVALLRRLIDRNEQRVNEGAAPYTNAQRRRLGYQLGQYLERAKQYDDAFDVYAEANRAGPVPIRADAYRRKIDDLIGTFSADFLRAERTPHATHGLDDAILIIGIPRTGSTLLEQILDRHPGCTGVGENRSMFKVMSDLPLQVESWRTTYPQLVHDMTEADANRAGRAYIDGLRASAGIGPSTASGRRNRKGAPRRLVDKALVNYEVLGLLELIAPACRVIDCRRDPVNTCFSCFASDLDPEVVPYSTDLEALGERYRQYERLMDHWHAVLTRLPVLRVQYEEVVADLETQTRRILEFLDLPWDDNCLTFYQSSTTAVTLSNEQVRQPIYRRSVDRAAAFGDRIDPLRRALSGQASADSA